MKKGFTIVEVSILFVIFLIVAFLVAPLSIDDTKQARNTSKWRSVQQDFTNIFYSLNTQKDEIKEPFEVALELILNNELKGNVPSYKITYLNGTTPEARYRFDNYKTTYANAIVSTKFFEKEERGVIGLLMYDVNGKKGPNTWGKDVFGYNIYKDRFEPYCKNTPISNQKQDCSKNGTGLCCSNYYLIGGNFD